MSQASKQVAIRWIEEVWNKRNETLLCALMSPECAGTTEGGWIADREEFIENMFRGLLAAFPDLRLEIEHVVAEGDEVMMAWRASGTHQGDVMGVAASGTAVAFRGMTWMRVRDGRIVEGLDSWNQSGLIAALQNRTSQGSVEVRSH